MALPAARRTPADKSATKALKASAPYKHMVRLARLIFPLMRGPADWFLGPLGTSGGCLHPFTVLE